MHQSSYTIAAGKKKLRLIAGGHYIALPMKIKKADVKAKLNADEVLEAGTLITKDGKVASLVTNNYDLLAGKLPEASNELMLIVDSYNKISADLYNLLGLTDSSTFNDVLNKEIKLIKINKFTEKTTAHANNMYRIYYPIIIRNSLEEEERRKLQEELDELIREADNEIIGSVQTIEIKDNLNDEL